MWKRAVLVFFGLGLGLLAASELLTLHSKDGFVLKGWLDLPSQGKPPYRLALMAHEYGSDHRMWKELAAQMRRRGYATLAVDLRGHGASDMRNGKKVRVRPGHFEADAKRIGFARIPDDLRAWMDRMEARKDIEIEEPVFFGSSLGGGAVIPLMIDYEPKVVVTLSPASPGNFNKREVMESVEESNSPWLIVSSQRDFARKSAEFYAAKALLPTLLIVPGEGHGSYTLPSAGGYIKAFLDRYLKR
ncbi:alpha/beta fold hydrolase [Nitratifractor sp.]|uniref:alpha/beta hydrolase n=1 Tax=Nitratifractor sp. TaxID=2268144 RepID=UPI0025F8F77F|nr:alpha/beta fold hydrolase [Nitratifractor sp.]